MPISKLKKETLSIKIIKEIENLIRNGELKPGEPLPSERELSIMLGVSRPPVREAIQALRALGIIDTNPGGGSYLRKDIKLILEHFKTKSLLTKYSAGELVEARLVIESSTVVFAIKRATEDDIKNIHKALIEVNNATGSSEKEYIEKDFNFHKAIAQAAHNHVMDEMMETTRGLMQEINALNVSQPEHIEKNMMYHTKIYEAIVSKNSSLAKKYMREHIKTIMSGFNHLDLEGKEA